MQLNNVLVFLLLFNFSWSCHGCADFIQEVLEEEGITQEVSEEKHAQELLGLQDGWIPDSALTASSQQDVYHGAQLARLNHARQGLYAGGWSAKVNDGHQWLQVDLGSQTSISQILTQGRGDADQWVKQFTVGFSDDGVKFRMYKDNGFSVVFRGNKDRNTVVKNTVDPPIEARYLKIFPCRWHSHISMRIELKGKDRHVLKHCPVSMDLGFVIDGSKKVSASNFLLEKQFVKQVASTLTISRHQSRVGLVTYSDNANVLLDFSGLNSFSDVDLTVRKTVFPNGRHQRLDLGLRAAFKALIKNQALGFVPQRSLVAITSHNAIDKRLWYIINVKKALEEKGIKVFLMVIGERKEALKRKLRLKGSDSIFFLPSFKSLATHAARIAHVICHHQNKETDIFKHSKTSRYQ